MSDAVSGAELAGGWRYFPVLGCARAGLVLAGECWLVCAGADWLLTYGLASFSAGGGQGRRGPAVAQLTAALDQPGASVAAYGRTCVDAETILAASVLTCARQVALYRLNQQHGTLQE